MAINLDVILATVANIVVGSIIVSPILWLAGRAIVGKENAKFTDAFWIVFLGNVIGGIVSALWSALFVGFSAIIIGAIIQLILWFSLVKHFFDCGGVKAFIITILAVVIFIVIAAIIGFIGFGLYTTFF
jgi:hypothetical protein